MSYCRFLDADVYVFMNVSGWLECCACTLESGEWKSLSFYSTQEMIDHLKAHVEAGHNVPDHVFKDLWADDKVNFPP
jgi:hypothetical protein